MKIEPRCIARRELVGPNEHAAIEPEIGTKRSLTRVKFRTRRNPLDPSHVVTPPFTKYCTTGMISKVPLEGAAPPALGVLTSENTSQAKLGAPTARISRPGAPGMGGVAMGPVPP